MFKRLSRVNPTPVGKITVNKHRQWNACFRYSASPSQGGQMLHHDRNTEKGLKRRSRHDCRQAHCDTILTYGALRPNQEGTLNTTGPGDRSEVGRSQITLRQALMSLASAGMSPDLSTTPALHSKGGNAECHQSANVLAPGQMCHQAASSALDLVLPS